MCWCKSKGKKMDQKKEGEGRRKKGEVGEKKCWPFLWSVLDSWFKYCQTPFWGSMLFMLSSWGYLMVMMTNGRQTPVSTVRSRWFCCHLSWQRAYGLDMGPILPAEPKKYVVENTKKWPPTHSRGKKIQKPLPRLNKTNKNLLPPKENHIGTKCPARSPHVCFYKAGRGYFVLDST